MIPAKCAVIAPRFAFCYVRIANPECHVAGSLNILLLYSDLFLFGKQV